MIRDMNNECFETGILDMSKVGTSPTNGRLIAGQKNFKTPTGTLIPGSTTPWGECGARLVIDVMKVVPNGGAYKPATFSGTGNVTFKLYDAENNGSATSPLSHLIGTYGPYTATEIATFAEANFENKPLLDVAIPATAKGVLQLTATASAAAGTAFVAGGLYARIVPNL